jgi:hypothetical protein
MADSVNAITLFLNQQDSVGANILTRTLGAFSYSGLVGEFIRGKLLTSGAEAQTLPTTNVLQLLLQNTTTGASGANITITATKQGGTGAILSVVQPGSVFVNWTHGPTGSGATAGYTAISLTASVTGATYEMFLGG